MGQVGKAQSFDARLGAVNDVDGVAARGEEQELAELALPILGLLGRNRADDLVSNLCWNLREAAPMSCSREGIERC